MNNLKEINGKFYKECELVMLATDKKIISSGIYEYSQISSGCEQMGWDSELRFTNSKRKMGDFGGFIKEEQHLYILSNEKINKGDWWYNHITGDIGQSNYKQIPIEWGKTSKIIATTDTSLYQIVDILDYSATKAEILLPKLSVEFIKEYIKSYNEGKKINKVLVEYYDSLSNNEDEFGNLIPDIYLKLNSSNEIMIKKNKEFYTREEHENSLRSLAQLISNKHRFGDGIFDIDKYIEENI